ncbi:aminotransferase class III-fold pyridoxal phosphate-dependent enzyme, partial [Azoarcus sp. TTM-91]|uniref:aminotransferase class III-fold pyridoxal phosphate-dependent enzyme n=1 Tax=Azoarcus sp. TTM-91 TaxID=2691581 RepID=UPI00145F8AEA
MNPAHAFWLPYTANRAFWKSPRVIRAASGHYYQTSAGDELLDGFSGLWTSGLGHCHPRIVAAVQSQVATLDYALGFQATNDKAVALAEQLSVLAPGDLDRVFFTNSGSEAVDTALKVALAYHRAKG